jgi:hypothetical protein
MALNRDQRRALCLLATAPNGGTEAIMLAHGFEHALLDDLVLRGLATTEQRAMRPGRRPIKVTWLMITEAGRDEQRNREAERGHRDDHAGGARMTGSRRNVSFRQLRTCTMHALDGNGPGRDMCRCCYSVLASA